ncbi:substrate-binding domain-containing protein [Paenibacillus filicis]|uniref:Substrate-binding domain-containing protein n=1 Tax=Paenibacillus gyeongsangnamensis TaxID=3388067 RepID=A0ABT4Q791_9BACL|nr:substrate-binding domain-containing protein [Paenibacillus filicis]MCZ8512742.1 substrate-binding domain-containing protein [Paenibacillus filicis]
MSAVRLCSRKKALSAVLLAVGLLAACSPASPPGLPMEAPKKSVMLVMKMKNNEYWKTVQMGAEAAAKEFNVSLNVQATEQEEDVPGQLALLNKVLQEGTNAIVLAANDYEALVEPVERAVSQRIPVITIDSEVHSGKVKSFIGINNFEAGRQAGEKLIALTGPQARIAVFVSGKGAKNMAEREQGLLSAVANNPRVQLITKEDCSEGPQLCEELTMPLLKNKIDGIVALNAVTSIGVAKKVEELGAGGRTKLVTFDTTPEELEWLQDGVIQATIMQNPFSMGYLGVKHAVDAMAGRKVPPRVETDTKVIDAENMFWSDNQKLLFPFVK